MTEKQQKILTTALSLFASEGYNVVPTSRIAREARVSEGLIFRHFGNKQGLLKALMQGVEEEIHRLFGPILSESDPQAVILRTIALPFEVDPEDYDYWRLQFKLKWEEGYDNPDKMRLVVDKLTWAFRERGAEDPEMEALLLTSIIDKLSIMLVRNELDDPAAYRAFLIKKYEN